MNLKFKILGIPKPKQSVISGVARTASGKTFTTHYKKEKTKRYETNLAFDIKSQLPVGFIPFTTPLRVKNLLYVFPIPSSFSKKKIKQIEDGILYYKPSKPDLMDNLNKPLFDAMEGLVYKNDSQIVELENASKIYGLIPRIELEIEEIIV